MDFDQLLALVTSDSPPAVTLDSRGVKPGDIFVAVKGAACDGHDFLPQAIENGASYLLCQSPPMQEMKLNSSELVLVEDTTIAAARLAQAANGCPAKKLINLAVTGTNGKTTVAFLASSIIKTAGKNCGLIGTISYDTSKEIKPARLTTPSAIDIAQMQRQMIDAGAQYMVIEASSHALHQNRLAGIDFKAAAFTNLSGDHLDYHKTEAQYLAAKSLLFENLRADAIAVLNHNSAHTPKIFEKTKASVLAYAIDSPADLTAQIESMDITGSSFTLEYKGQKQLITTFLPGKFNIANCLAAAGLAIAAGFSLSDVANGIEALKTIPGRLEKIESAADFTVLIDYAHTDDALENVLTTLKPLCRGRLTVLFGCGGDRDKTKRPRMAAVAEKCADRIIVTSDNPRSEHPAEILGEIALGFDNPASENIVFEIERDRAIAQAINTAKKNDIVLIAGKGHEDYQILENQTIHFSDKEIAENCLRELE
jgi:UDP-N-acetylmuramoyl-L-alanyl-D-glutamate--2,6-diaminopimelate ligase